jgi:tRNA(fMet)-specific endonuclease VapC
MSNQVLIDTDVFSYIFNGHPNALIFEPYLRGKELAITFVTIAQVYSGAYKGKWGDTKIRTLERFLRRFIHIESTWDISLKWAEIKEQCRLTGYPIESQGCWVAACAVYYNCPLATYNRKHFEPVNGIMLLPT